jgi:ACS family tartrate transporter-like MFS transporter
MDGVAGLQGWQWLFLVEGLPAVALGFATLYCLPDKPRAAQWLSKEDAERLERMMLADQAAVRSVEDSAPMRVFADFRMWTLIPIGFGFISGMIGLSLWLPQIVKSFGLTVNETGFVTAIPYVFASVAMIFWSRHSDRQVERPWHTAGSAFLACIGFVAASQTSDARVSMCMLTLAAVGIFSGAPPFWSWVSSVFKGTTAAVGIAFVNSIVNLGGFFGPAVFGWLKTRTGGFMWPLIMLGFMLLTAALLSVALSFWGRSGNPVSVRVSESG